MTQHLESMWGEELLNQQATTSAWPDGATKNSDSLCFVTSDTNNAGNIYPFQVQELNPEMFSLKDKVNYMRWLKNILFCHEKFLWNSLSLLNLKSLWTNQTHQKQTHRHREQMGGYYREGWSRWRGLTSMNLQLKNIPRHRDETCSTGSVAGKTSNCTATNSERTYCREHLLRHGVAQTLCWTPNETNVTLYFH